MALVALFNAFVVRAHLHRTKVEPKAKIFFDVCRFFFDIFFRLFTAGAHRALEDQAQVDTRCLINVVASQDIWVSLQVCCYLLLLFRRMHLVQSRMISWSVGRGRTWPVVTSMFRMRFTTTERWVSTTTTGTDVATCPHSVYSTSR